jgi:hypothetical protein
VPLSEVTFAESAGRVARPAAKARVEISPA